MTDLDTERSRATKSGGEGPNARVATILRRGLNLDRMFGVYLLVLLIVVFTLLLPETFGSASNFRVMAASQAIGGILTLGLVISLISGVFDISIAANMSLAISLVGWLQAEQQVDWRLAIVITLLTGAFIGVINAVIITRLHVAPIIATLGMSAILAAAAFWVAQGNNIIYGISPGFTKLGSSQFLGLGLPFWCFAIVAVLLWYALGYTPWGRYLYAAGANPQATRLSGLRVVPLQWSALILSGTLAALAGVVLSMQLGASSFGAGGPYLLPAFAAAFLGSTLVQAGRFNVVGTVLALYILAVAVKGLQLQFPGAPWIANFVEGVTLIGAVAIAARTTRNPVRV